MAARLGLGADERWAVRAAMDLIDGVATVRGGRLTIVGDASPANTRLILDNRPAHVRDLAVWLACCCSDALPDWLAQEGTARQGALRRERLAEWYTERELAWLASVMALEREWGARSGRDVTQMRSARRHLGRVRGRGRV